MVPVCFISRSHRLKINFQDETLKTFLSETKRPRALIFGMWAYTTFVQIMPLGPKMGPPLGVGGEGDHMFFIDIYRENMKKSSCLKPQGP